MYKEVTVGDKAIKGLKNMLLVPVWMAAHIVSWLVLIAGLLSARILRKVCYVALFLDIVMVCITGAFGVFLAFLAVIGIVWAIPSFMDFVIERCGDTSDLIVNYWHTPAKPRLCKEYAQNIGDTNNTNTQSNNTNTKKSTNVNKNNTCYSNAKQASTEKPPAYSKCKIVQTPHGTRVIPMIETPEVIALPPASEA